VTQKNLVLFHLESIAWQTFNAFPEAFPNLAKFIPQARLFTRYFASATSTQMVLTYLFHGNDFEIDAEPGLARPAANNSSLFTILKAAGYRTECLCLAALRSEVMLPMLAETLGPIWSTSDLDALTAKFDAVIAAPPFAIYVWNLVSHIEHAIGLTPHLQGMDELVGSACAVADHALGTLLASLERQGVLDETTVLVFGDHGDDFYTHGFKSGALHGVEPYTHLIHAPLLIRDAALPAGTDPRIASTVDLAPTLLELLGIKTPFTFAHSGQSLVGGSERRIAFSQNYAGNQRDNAGMDIRKAFSASDATYTLMATSRGLELFNHRLDPTNHCNLLHFFDLDRQGEIRFRPRTDWAHPHFATGMALMLRDPAIGSSFRRLRDALRDQLAEKQSYIVSRNPRRLHTLDPACFDRINRHGRNRFFGTSQLRRVWRALPGTRLFQPQSRLRSWLRQLRRRLKDGRS
jgi:hypothetical protein